MRPIVSFSSSFLSFCPFRTDTPAVTSRRGPASSIPTTTRSSDGRRKRVGVGTAGHRGQISTKQEPFSPAHRNESDHCSPLTGFVSPLLPSCSAGSLFEACEVAGRCSHRCRRRQPESEHICRAKV